MTKQREKLRQQVLWLLLCYHAINDYHANMSAFKQSLLGYSKFFVLLAIEFPCPKCYFKNIKTKKT